MPQITLPIELPAIDLSTVVPLLALVVLAALILITLTARSLIKSRAFTIATVAAVVVLGSSTIVGSLQSIAVLIGVAGAVTIGLVIVLGRTPDVTELLHTVVARREPPAPQLPTAVITQPPLLNAPRQAAAPTRRRASSTVNVPKDWGF